VVGGDIQRNQIRENLNIDTQYLSNTQNIGGSGISAVCPDHANNCDPIFSREKTHAQAAFVNGDYDFTDQFSLVAGARYTDTSIAFRGCNQAGVTIANQPVPGVTSSLRDFFNFLYGNLTGNAGANPIPDSPTACITLDNVSRNGAPATFLPTDSAQTLSQSNVSWNVTANYKPVKEMLLYARIARGYKSGSFPTIGASTSVQFQPAKQESLLAYEGGYKLTLLDHRLQLDGALFYYDYKDKQLSNFVPDAVFGPLVAIVNVPKSRVLGSEVEATLVPVQGLSLRAAVTYVDTRITEFNGFNVDGAPTDLSGQRFNLTPMWSGTFDVDYRFPISGDLSGYVGAGATSNSRTSGVIGATSSDYDIRAYTTLDLQAGIESSKGWTVGIFGKNVTDRYYWTNVNHVSDTIVRVAGLPAMYGVRFRYHF
jgi:outer membrane receptor protein involved in Fe transport